MKGDPLHCLRCGHDWHQGRRWLPVKCPNCMQPWMKPYVLKTWRGMTHQPLGRIGVTVKEIDHTVRPELGKRKRREGEGGRGRG